MPGENCSIPGCGVCRGRNIYKGIAIFQIPQKKEGDAGQNKWRSDFLAKIGRETDADFSAQIAKNHVYACERHFDPNDYNVFPTRKKLKYGAIPSKNLPQKSIETKRTTREPPKVREFVPPTQSSDCYGSFRELCSRVKSLKSLSHWTITKENGLRIEKPSDQYVLPEVCIYVDEDLNFLVQVLGWRLPKTAAMLSLYESSMKNLVKIWSRS